MGRPEPVQARPSKVAAPAYLAAAFIAMEDRRFYHHSGIDFVGLGRAAWLDWRAGRYVAGGSTITQQTAKMLYTTRQRTVDRKLKELAKAIRLGTPAGNRQGQMSNCISTAFIWATANYGVDAAAKSYFGISARQVTLPQAAMLAALTRAPTVFSPRRDLAAAQQRAATRAGERWCDRRHPPRRSGLRHRPSGPDRRTPQRHPQLFPGRGGR